MRKRKRTVGYIVFWADVGMYWDEAAETLFNGMRERISVFPTHQGARGAIQRAKKYWTARESVLSSEVYRIFRLEEI